MWYTWEETYDWHRKDTEQLAAAVSKPLPLHWPEQNSEVVSFWAPPGGQETLLVLQELQEDCSSETKILISFHMLKDYISLIHYFFLKKLVILFDPLADCANAFSLAEVSSFTTVFFAVFE